MALQRRMKLKTLMEQVSFYFLLAVGFVSVRYDFERCMVCTSRWHTAYAYAANALLLLCIPVTLHVNTEFMETFFGENEVLQRTDIIGSHITAAVIVLMILTRRQRERTYSVAMREIFAMEQQYFAKVPLRAKIERRYEHIYYVKFTFTFMLWIGAFYMTLVFSPVIDVQAILMAVYYATTAYLSHGLIFYYYTSMLYACKYYETLNEDLKQLWCELKRLSRQSNDIVQRNSCTWRHMMQNAADELRLMAEMHWSVTCALKTITASYAWFIKTILLAFIFDMVTNGYYTVLVYNGSLNQWLGFGWRFSGIGIYCIGFMDMFLFYWLCEHTAHMYNDTNPILTRFRFLPLRNAAFEQQSEAFMLQMKYPFSICLGNMIPLNMATFLALCGFILQHTLILIQYDFCAQLGREWKAYMHGTQGLHTCIDNARHAPNSLVEYAMDLSREQASRILFAFMFNYFFLVGMISHRYDVLKLRIHPSTWRRLCAYTITVVMLLIMPFVFYNMDGYALLIGRNDFLRRANALNTFFTFGGTAYSLLSRWHIERSFVQLLRAYFRIERDYLSKYKPSKEVASFHRQFNYYFLTQITSHALQLGVLFYLMLVIPSHLDVNIVLVSLYFTSFSTILQTVYFMMIVVVMLLRKCFIVLNWELRLLYAEIARLPANGTWPLRIALATEKLARLTRLHWQVRRMTQCLNENYQCQFIAATATFITTTVLFGYYTVMTYEGELEASLSQECVIFGCLNSYLLPIFTTYLFYTMCDALAVVNSETLEILRKFQNLRFYHHDFELQLEVYALQLTRNDVQIKVGNVLLVNLASFLALLGFIIRHTIILVQSDYGSRRKNAS